MGNVSLAEATMNGLMLFYYCRARVLAKSAEQTREMKEY